LQCTTQGGKTDYWEIVFSTLRYVDGRIETLPSIEFGIDRKESYCSYDLAIITFSDEYDVLSAY